MKNEEIAKKMINYLKKNKYKKFDRLLLKQKNNEELWDILLENPIITEYYLENEPPFNMNKLNISIQKNN